MPDESPLSAVAPRAVFLSYASQDVVAALRICHALRAAGIEVWFDQNELGGGDGWDRKIRLEIRECALFMPVLSAATQARLEGYFRLEWKLAAQRTHTMADAKPFLLPVVIDGTRDADAHVPEEFRAVQWTRLPGGETSAAFCSRVKKLLGRGAPAPENAARAPHLPFRVPRWAVRSAHGLASRPQASRCSPSLPASCSPAKTILRRDGAHRPPRKTTPQRRPTRNPSPSSPLPT